MTSSSLGSTLRFIGIIILALGILTTVLVVMGARLDNQDPAPPAATNAEKARQDLAIDAARIETLSSTLNPVVSEHAREWKRAIGDVWVPWPNGAPEGFSNPDIDLGAPSSDAGEISAALSAFAQRLIESDLDPELSTSIAIAAMTDARALNAESACADIDFGVLGPLVADGTSVKNLDIAKQWFELDLAVKNTQDDRSRVELTDDLINAALSSGAPDARTPIASDPSESDPGIAAYDLVLDQLVFLAAHSEPADRSQIVNFSCALSGQNNAPATNPLPGVQGHR